MRLIFLQVIRIWLLALRGKYLENDCDNTSSQTFQKATIDDSQIAKALMNLYFALWHINLAQDTISDIKAPPPFDRITKESGGVFSKSKNIILDFIGPRSKESFAEFFDKEIFFQKAKDKAFLTTEYQGTVNGWARGNIFIIDRDARGNPVNLIYAVVAVTDRKKQELGQETRLREALEKAKSASKAKSDFLARMSHDIRTPMNAIVGMTAIARENVGDKEKVKDCLTKISISSKHLLSLISEVLDMSNIESGKVTLDEDDFNIAKLLDETLVVLGARISQKRHTLNAFVENLTDEVVSAPSLRVQQLFMTILTNAIKYTSSGGVINVTLRQVPAIMAVNQTDKEGVAYYEFIVKDNGQGISEDFIDNLFLPFEQYDGENTPLEERGVGLGLPIAKKIANLLGGDISVDSALGVGSVFTATFCLKIAKTKALDTSALQGKSVLVISDNERSRANIIRVLQELSMKALFCTGCAGCVDYSKATTLIKAHSPNNDEPLFAIIYDCTTQTRDNIKAVATINQAGEKTLPIIMTSREALPNIEMNIRKAGVDVFLTMPLYKTKLARALLSTIEENKIDDAKAAPQKLSPTKNKPILLVDDNDLNRDIASEILSMMGYKTEGATNGAAALKLFTKNGAGYYSLIFMDLQMPVMDGFSTTKAIRASDAEDAKSIPIIAMSANAFSEDVKASIAAGMNGHIAKPLDLGVLKKVLDKYVLGK